MWRGCRVFSSDLGRWAREAADGVVTEYHLTITPDRVLEVEKS